MTHQHPERSNAHQVASFIKDGYLLFPQPVFRPHDFERLKRRFQILLDGWERLGAAPPEHMDKPHFVDTSLFEWLFHDDVMSILIPLIGRDIGLWASHFICKPAGAGKRIPWHDDSLHWGPVFEPMEVVTVWLALDRSTKENGCLRVLPGSHRGPHHPAPQTNPSVGSFSRYEFSDDSLDESAAVDIELEPNWCSVHHARLIHGSNPNASENRRCGFAMRYFPTSSRYLPEVRSRPGFKIYLACGVDHAGNTYGTPREVNHDWLERNPQYQEWFRSIQGAGQ